MNQNIDIFGVEIDMNSNDQVLKASSHSGIFTAGIYMFMKLSGLINELSKRGTIDFDQYKLVFSGHSLGGAMS